MLSALRTEDHRQVVLLREHGLARAEELRAEAREERIVCEVCAQPVVVRAGAERTWHFAHRSREDCPKAQESLEMIECRALLYGWLMARFPGSVQIEKVLPGFPRPVDCWVDRPGKAPFAWWLVTAALRPEVRHQLTLGFAQQGALPHYVLLARMLTRDPEHSKGFLLGTTERELMRPSSYGELYFGGAQSLHYLDPEARRLSTCRGLTPFHPPQGYRAELREEALEEVRLLPSTGEFVLPGEAERLKDLLETQRLEAERLKARQLEVRRQEAKLREARRLAAEREEADRQSIRVAQPMAWAAEPECEPEVDEGPWAPEALRPSPEAVRPPQRPEAQMYTCRTCGCRTPDWVVLYGNTGECKCRACSRRPPPPGG